jgi:hypothetical protein
MREVSIAQDLNVNIRPLKRKQIKGLKKKGFNVTTASIFQVKAEQWDEFIDALVTAYCPRQAQQVIAALDEMDNPRYRDVCMEFIAETWGSEVEEKNS